MKWPKLVLRSWKSRQAYSEKIATTTATTVSNVRIVDLKLYAI